QHLLRAVPQQGRRRPRHGRPARLSSAADVPRRSAARGAARLRVRRHHQRLRRDARLPLADRRARSLGDRRLREGAPVVAAGDRNRRARRRARAPQRTCSRRGPCRAGQSGNRWPLMAEQHLHYDEAALNDRPDAAIAGVGSKGLLAGGIGVLALGAGGFLDFSQFLQSYLIGYLFIVCLMLGCLALTMVHHLTGGAWGMVSRRIWEAGTRTLPLVALLFLPIALNLETLYSWARPEAASDPIIQLKAPYLNEPFFYVRAVIFFAVWGLLVFFLNRWSA